MSQKTRVALVAMIAVGGLLTFAVAQDKTEEAPAKKTLYEQLGGVYPIAAVIDDFVERLLVNDILNANPAIKKARSVPKAGLKYQVISLVCQSIGGPQKYVGRSMKESHKHLNITEAEWVAMAADFKATLDKFKVPAAAQAELFRVVGTTKGDIVTK